MSLNSEFTLKKFDTDFVDDVDFSGTWINELGSILILTCDANQVIKGSYKTAKGAPSHKEVFSLVGFASGDLISFSVNFGKYGTLTSWVGQHTLENDIEVIKTSWLLAKNIADQDEEKDLWGAILTGANTFKRLEQDV